MKPVACPHVPARGQTDHCKRCCYSRAVDSDHELLARWGNDESAAGSELFARYFRGLFRFFATKVDDEVDDLVQSTLLDCVKYRERLRAADNFKAYLYAIARRRLYRHLSATRSKAVDFGVSSIMDLGGSPSSIVARHAEEQNLVRSLRTLPVELQVLLELHYWEEMTVDDAAKVLELPLGTAKSRLRRARRMLREKLGIDPDAPDDAFDRSVAAARVGAAES